MNYLIALVVTGIAALGMAWMPAIGNKIRISYALIYLILGVLLYLAFPSIPRLNLIKNEELAVRLTELVVIIALMGSGLKIDQPFSLKKWAVAIRLVSVGMLLCIGITAFAAWYWIGMDVASAIILAAVLAPTDPVLASDVQVGPPNESEKDPVKFTLTAEGGMNDGTAFPFVWLGILLAGHSGNSAGLWPEWIGFYLIYKIVAGIVCGYLFGKGLAYLIFKLPEKYRSLKIQDGFVALSITLLVYGVAELIKGYGFIAVFTCAVSLRNYEIGHQFHRTLHSFSDQIERILVAITLLIFGGALVNGILDALTFKLAILGVCFLFVIRPITTWFFLSKNSLPQERIFISFFGIRGIGSIYYISFAFQHAQFEWEKELWSTVAFIILASIIIHGLSANSAIRKMTMIRNKDESRSQ